MNKEVKPKIEAIYPLNTMQTGLLFHHLTEKDDQGFLNVQCTIDGDLNIDLLKRSWVLVTKRHPVLRTTVHWEKIKKPVQLVKPNITFNWTELDWTSYTKKIQQQKLEEYKVENKNIGLNFQKKPLAKISLIKTKKNSHYLVWCCHHLLLDGWSSSIILKDVFTFYDALFTNIDPNLENVPSYKSYLNWQKTIDINSAKTFWKNNFKDFKEPFLFNKNHHKINSLRHNHIELSDENTLKVHQITKTFQITSNTLFLGIWSAIIFKYNNIKDITFGNTVSGRSGNFPNIDLIAGMFANVLPVRTILSTDLSIKDWLKNIQLQQLEARKYEHFTVGEITEWVDNTSNSLFDSLLIFENFPWNDIESGDIKVHSSKSGITTTYPLTIIIKTGELIAIDLLSEKSLFSNETNNWILKRFEEIINILHKNKELEIESLLEEITSIDNNVPLKRSKNPNKTNSIVLPKNKTEVELLRIWQNLLNKDTISTADNFFEIGGKSLLAVRLFSIINTSIHVQLSPTTILEHPTIASLAKLISKESIAKIENWNNLVPLRSKGIKEPIFCLHAGGGHVFFYNLLAKYLDKNRPVYAIQPSGLYGKLPKHETIKDMATDYVKEILMAYPEGPYNLMVYCHSTAVGFEMSNLLKNMGHKANLIVIDTMAEQEYLTSDRLKMRLLGFLSRLSKKPLDVIGTMITYRYKKYIKPFYINLFGSTEAKHTSKTTVHLINIYNKYKWKPYNLDITLVLTKKVNKLFNQEISSSWNKITNNVTIIKTEGDHRTLFDEPDVQFIAKTLDNYLK